MLKMEPTTPQPVVALPAEGKGGSECDRVRERYQRRKSMPQDRYSPLAPDVLMAQQEKVRAIIRRLKRERMTPLAERRLLEIGCGNGMNLLLFLSLGFRPQNLVGNELLPERVMAARALLPATVSLMPGDALEIAEADGSFDIVFQSTVFTSILDQSFRLRLAERMWRLVKPGGGILWYDFAFNNPANPDVRGVSRREIGTLFPAGRVRGERITLAPPLGRRVAPLHMHLYTLLNLCPFLRTHWLCWIAK